jgi:L-ascorbate metabolism protein UlaG (beta-lactamase superfamily)
MWALGQHGFLLKGQHTTVIIDPYLSNWFELEHPGAGLERQVPIVIQPDEMSFLDYALITHDHADHADLLTLQPMMAAASVAHVFTSWKASKRLTTGGLDSTRIRVSKVDQAVQVNAEFSFTPIPAAHYEFEPDEDGEPAYLGFLIELNGVKVYHAGDTLIYDGLLERLKGKDIDLFLLPSNGRDWYRDEKYIIGNLDYREAVELTARAGARVLIPTHNDLFVGNRINPATILDYANTQYPQQRIHFLRAGELYYYAG